MPRGVYVRTDEYRAKLRKAMSGRQLAPTTRTKVAEARTTHGMSKSPLYAVWRAMRQRCSNSENAAWHNYGGRGITVCPRWATFEHFLADMGERPPGESIERIDNDGNYEPGNCRWATRSEQANNRRRHGFASRTWRPYTTQEA